jgi:hypothetical protein
MKKFIATFFLLQILTVSSGQNTDVKILVDSLQYLKADTLDCNATLYWKIISEGEKAIPFLIDKLTDTTQTNVSHSCKVTKLNVGEVAYFALQQIAFFPAFAITHIQFDVIYGNGCWSFFDYLFDNANRKDYQNLVRQWYETNKTKFHTQKISKKKQTACQKKFHIDSYLVLTE